MLYYQLDHYSNETMLGFIKVPSTNGLGEKQVKQQITDGWENFHVFEDFGNNNNYNSNSIQDFIKWFNLTNGKFKIEQIFVEFIEL